VVINMIADYGSAGQASQYLVLNYMLLRLLCYENTFFFF